MQTETETALGMTEPAIAPTGGAEEAAGDSSVNGRMLDRLLGMARGYHSEGNLRQAMEMYWTLLENHPGTSQAQGARVSLLDQAEAYEREGARHVARAVYERLL
ncbi:tol-pal system YbgF family protein [Halomonas sp.]|uniref:tetratricopeptide repeat protein n=1 Tax=Halomonas sp. TaxID=1486246 RepID=UPI003566C6CA